MDDPLLPPLKPLSPSHLTERRLKSLRDIARAHGLGEDMASLSQGSGMSEETLKVLMMGDLFQGLSREASNGQE